MRLILRRLAALALALLVTSGVPALVQCSRAAQIFENVGTFPPPVLGLDPSAISVGMGGAGAAMWWSPEPNYWANPALLGYYRGVRWQSTHSQLLPGFDSDISHDAGRLTLAGSGVGLEFAGRPPWMPGSIGVDYNVNLGTDTSGNPITFRGSDEVGAFGVGVSLARLADAIAVSRGHERSGLLSHFDVAGGWAEKRTDLNYESLHEAATTHDYGIVLSGGGTFREADAARFDVHASYAHAVLNYDDVRFESGDGFSSPPPARMFFDGGAVHVGFHRSLVGTHTGFAALMLSGLEPLIALDLAYDHEVSQDAVSDRRTHTDHQGLQVSAFNVASLRFGSWSHGATFGFGLALPVGDLGGVRYDYGRMPHQSGFDAVTRTSYSVWLEPLAIWRASR